MAKKGNTIIWEKRAGSRDAVDLYYRIVQKTTMAVYDNTAGEMAEDPDWADTAIALDAFDAVVGGWPLVLPASLPIGSYYLVIYNNASPADTDQYVDVREGIWQYGHWYEK